MGVSGIQMVNQMTIRQKLKLISIGGICYIFFNRMHEKIMSFEYILSLGGDCYDHRQSWLVMKSATEAI